MKKIDQTIFGDKKGNCFSTCVACIIEKNIDEIPNFCVEYEDWYRETEKWLDSNGYSIVYIKNNCKFPNIVLPLNYPIIVSGTSPRGNFGHSVIYLNEKLYHDPHPDRSGLKDINDYIIIFKK